MSDKVYRREQNTIADQAYKRQQRRESFDSKLSKVLPAFVKKIQRIDNMPDADYPFPLNGSDLVATFNDDRHYAWYLAGEYQGPTFVYMLKDGTLVSRQDLYNPTVKAFSFNRASDNLIEQAVKNLKIYLKKKDVHLKPIHVERRSRTLQQQLSEFRYQ